MIDARVVVPFGSLPQLLARVLRFWHQKPLQVETVLIVRRGSLLELAGNTDSQLRTAVGTESS